ncbi:hypothetical protein ACSBM8_11275 [Sphingomonas sp. ASY06-1R]|jgi:hypothetical protein
MAKYLTFATFVWVTLTGMLHFAIVVSIAIHRLPLKVRIRS